MPAKNRADLINKLHKVCKKEYSLITTPSNRTVLEHMIYGAVLEDSTFEAADEAFAKLEENFYDWNEVRVTTRAELAEIVKMVSDPVAAASRVKKSLHGVFEKYYQFDLEFFKKENLSNAVQSMQTFTGVSEFTISYTAQNGLGGHSIPIDQSLMNLMYAIGAVNEKELAQRKIPGLERTIAKAKGIEFSTLVHQLAVAFTSSPFSSNVRNIILKIAPDAKERFPKRGSSKPKKVAEVVEEKPAKKEEPKKEPAPKASVKKKAPAKKAATKKAAAKKATKKAPAKKASKTSGKKKAPAKKAAKSTKKKASKSSSKKLAKKKPR